MSDSESSSSSASDSPRGGSPEPEAGATGDQTQAAGQLQEPEEKPSDEATIESDVNLNVNISTAAETADDAAEPEPTTVVEEVDLGPDAKPLHISRNGGQAEPSDSTIAVDIVVVHGVYGTWDDGAKSGPGSGTTEWVVPYLGTFQTRCRALRFEYDALQLFSGPRSREAIRSTAMKLLRAVSAVRKNETQKRFIIFVAHDIGGIIVKDALSVAALERATWLDIFEMSRVSIFQGCPHRSADIFEMEDRLCRFLFATYDSTVAKVRPSIASISSLAAAVIEINGAFVESKIPLRSRIVSIHRGDSDGEYFNQAFDNFCGTMGLPLERRIQEQGEDYSTLTEYLDAWVVVVNTEITANHLLYEREIISLASPIYPLQSGQVSNFVEDTEQWKSWLAYPGPQILYIHGTNRVREAAEQTFYALDDRTRTDKKRTIALYFSFDRHDVRCDSLRDMLSTFLAQIMCRYPKLGDRIKLAFARFKLERGWTETDLVYWFERFRFTDEFDQVMFVINYFDECTKGSQKLFLDNFAYLSQASENPWKVIITSHKPGALSNELQSPWCVNLDLAAAGLDTISTTDYEEEIYRLIQFRPELHLQDSLIREELQQLEKFDPLVRHIFWEQARVRSEWPGDISIQKLFASFDLNSESDTGDQTLAKLIQWVLEGISEKSLLQRLLTWLLYSVRPLSIWEIATVMYIGSDQDLGDISPSSSVVAETVDKITTWLAGIISIEHNEVKFHHPRLRNILMGNIKDLSLDGKAFLWEQVKPTAHLDIARLCLEYFSRPPVHELIDKSFEDTDSETFESPTFADRGNLCSYALQAWTYHFLLSSPRPDLSKLLAQSSPRNLARSLARGYWALSNPITRSVTCFETLFPLFSGLGLTDVVEPKDEADIRQGLFEAAAKGKADAVKQLLAKVQRSDSTLMDALVASGASGNQDIMIDLLNQVVASRPDPKAIDWPPTLLHRAAWIGLDRFADKLLELGCSPDIDIEWNSIIKASPLSQAARNYHVGMVQTLLRHNADVNSRHLYNRTPFHHVAGIGHAEVVKILVEEGKVDLEITDEDGFTTLYFACLWGHYHAVEVLLDLGADPNMGIEPDVLVNKWSPLIVAVDDGYKQCVKLMLAKKANPNISGPSSIGTPIRYAAVNGYLEICQMLIDSGADPNSSLIDPPILIQVINDFSGDGNQLDVIDLLLSHNADANAKDSAGTPVLIHGVRSAQSEAIVKRLLNHGADVNLLDANDCGALYYAAEDKDLSVVQLLLEKNANVNQLNTTHVTPLYFAIPTEDKTLALLEKGADPDVSVNSGFTALMYAAWFSHVESVKHLLDHKASLELEYSGDDDGLKGWSALSCAAAHGTNDVVRLLAENGADLRRKGADGVPVLHLAARAETLPAMMEFPHMIDIEQTDNNGATILHLAGVSIENFTRMVNAGANLDAQDTIMRDTPISIAAYNNYEDRAKLLIKRGANLNLGSPSDGSALHQACRRGNWDIMKLLVENGADVNYAVEGISGTPLQSACLQYSGNAVHNYAEMVDYLLANGADVLGEGGLIGSAIAAATLTAPPSLLKTLLDKGAKVDVTDPIGRTPLQAAAFHGFDNFEVILGAGGDIKARDEMGRTALHWAAQPGRLQVVEKLLSLLPTKEVVNDPDVDGWTPLCWAARGSDCWLDESYAGEEANQIGVIKHLLENGADRSVLVNVNGQKWSPLKIARFSGASEEVIDLLKKGLTTAVEESEKTEEEKENSDESEPEHDKSKTANQRTSSCDACRCSIRGFAYHCKECVDFDLCFKCYPHRKLFHASDHGFEERGPEFVETPEDEADEASSDTTASSDDDSD